MLQAPRTCRGPRQLREPQQPPFPLPCGLRESPPCSGCPSGGRCCSPRERSPTAVTACNTRHETSQIQKRRRIKDRVSHSHHTTPHDTTKDNTIRYSFIAHVLYVVVLDHLPREKRWQSKNLERAPDSSMSIAWCVFCREYGHVHPVCTSCLIEVISDFHKHAQHTPCVLSAPHQNSINPNPRQVGSP